MLQQQFTKLLLRTLLPLAGGGQRSPQNNPGTTNREGREGAGKGKGSNGNLSGQREIRESKNERGRE